MGFPVWGEAGMRTEDQMKRCFQRLVRGLEIMYPPPESAARVQACRRCPDFSCCGYAKDYLIDLIPPDAP